MKDKVLDLAQEIVSKLAENDIKSHISRSKTTSSVYIYPDNLPNIRVSDHNNGEKYRDFAYNVIIGGRKTIYFRDRKPTYYFGENDLEIFIINMITLKKRKTNL